LVDAPVFDDKSAPLQGTNYLAMLYGGPTPENIIAIPPAEIFRTGSLAGYFDNPENARRTIPGVIAGREAFVRVRAWDARLGPTYEEAQARNIGGYGESEAFAVQTGGCFQCDPKGLVGLKSFSLRPLNGVIARFFRRTESEIVIQAYGSFPRYQLQQITALELNQSWQNIGEPTAELNFTNTITDTSRFFRVVGLPE